MRTDDHVRATLEAVLDAMPSGIIIVNAPTGDVAYVNHRAGEIFRTTPPELQDPTTYRDNPAFRIDGSPVPVEELPLVRALCQGEVAEGVELAFDNASGVRTYYRCNAAPVRAGGGEIVAAVCAFEDITPRIEAERQREQAERFRELFVGMLGHDLRNPLSAITFGARLLAERAALGPEEARVLARVAAAGERMRRMIDQILDLTRIRVRGNIPLCPRPMSLTDLVRRIVDELAPAHPGRTVRLHEDGDAEGTWDPDRLGQVVSNLVGNALEHTPPEVAVDVAVERLCDGARLAVHNSGAPIASDLLPVIFDPFRPRRDAGDRPGSAAPRGLGLGLYIAREIVVAHGGRLDVTSAAEIGTTFTVTLPGDPGLRSRP
jgi:signal transduction histidine kinase